MAPSSPAHLLAPPRRFMETARRDLWWVTPLLTFLGFSTFIVYSTWAAFQNAHYWSGGYLSPFYSPEIFGDSPHAVFGGKPAWWPGAIPWSPAFLILWAPGLFRFTCYYYRGAYYKAFWGDPPACAVGEPRASYWGEQSFPLLLQNAHRYFMYVAVIFLFILAYDVWLALWFRDPGTGAPEFGVGLGTLVLAVNVVLLSSYTLGCHVMRHVAGGNHDEVSKHPICDRAYACSSALNDRHQLFAWMSLFSVAFADIYVRLCSMGIWTDLRIL
jgi:hypothetical protein